MEGQFDLFSSIDEDNTDNLSLGDAEINVPDVEEWDKKTKLNFEREMLGLYVSDHPLSGLSAVLSSLSDMSIAELIDKAKTMNERTKVTLAGLITGVDRRVSKQGNAWAIITLEDMESSIQCMFFSKAYEAAANDFAIDQVAQIRGEVEVRDETVSLRGKYFEIPSLESIDSRPLNIVLPNMSIDKSKLDKLSSILCEHPGCCEVRLALIDSKGRAKVLAFGDRFRVKRDMSLFAELKILFGPACLPGA